MLPPFRLRPLLPPVRCSSTPLHSQSVPVSLPGPCLDDAPGFVVNSSPSVATRLARRIVLRTMLVAASWGRGTLGDSLSPGRSGRCGLFGSADTSPGIAIPSLRSGGAVLVPPPVAFLGGLWGLALSQAGRLTCPAVSRSDSEAADRESQACRPSSGPGTPR
jgi:hypothetical protein